MKLALEADADREIAQVNTLIVALFEHVKMNGQKRIDLKNHLKKPRFTAAPKTKEVEWSSVKGWFKGGAKK